MYQRVQLLQYQVLFKIKLKINFHLKELIRKDLLLKVSHQKAIKKRKRKYGKIKHRKILKNNNYF